MPATLTATPDLTNVPPRVRLDVTVPALAVGLSVSITRLDPDGRSQPVRLADPAVITGSVWVGFDYEAPFGMAVTYTATVTYLPGSRMNGLTNPGFETNVLGWVGGTHATLTRDTAQHHSGSASLRMDTDAANHSADSIASVSSAPSTPVTASVWVKGSGTAYIFLAFESTSGSSAVVGSTVTLTSSWQQISVTGTTPADILTAKPMIRQLSGGSLSMWIDDGLSEESATLGAQFDGDTPDAGGMVYDWTSVAGASTSTEHAAGAGGLDTVTATATLAVSDVWLIHPGVPDLSMLLAKVRSLDDRWRVVNRGVFGPFGRSNPIVVTDGRRKAVQSQLVIRTRTLDELDALIAITDDAAVLLLNIPASLGWGVTNEYINLGDLVESREAFATFPTRVLSAPYLVVSRPIGGSQSQRTYADVLTEAATYQAINQHATYLDLLAPTS